VQYDKDLEWHQWNRAAKQRIMISNAAEPPSVGLNPFKQATPSQGTPARSWPTIVRPMQTSVVHAVTPQDLTTTFTPAEDDWEDLNLFGETMNEMEDTPVPNFQAQGSLRSHSFTDSVEDFTVPSGDQVCIDSPTAVFLNSKATD
jgi:hypothetical protein